MQWKVTHNIPEVTAEFVACAKAIEQARPVVLRAIGVQLLSWGFTDFRDKSEGKAAGGVTWKGITEGAIRTRLLARKPYRTLVEQAKASALADKPLREQLRKKLPKGKSANMQKARGLIAINFEKANPELAAGRKKRLAIWGKKQALIAKEWSGAKIGVDTGRLANSLIFGVADLKMRPMPEKKTDKPKKPLKPAVFLLEDRAVTVGTAMDYAKGFDELRPIFGPQFVDKARADKLEALGQRAQVLHLKRAAKKHVEVTGE